MQQRLPVHGGLKIENRKSKIGYSEVRVSVRFDAFGPRLRWPLSLAVATDFPRIRHNCQHSSRSKSIRLFGNRSEITMNFSQPRGSTNSFSAMFTLCAKSARLSPAL